MLFAFEIAVVKFDFLTAKKVTKTTTKTSAQFLTIKFEFLHFPSVELVRFRRQSLLESTSATDEESPRKQGKCCYFVSNPEALRQELIENPVLTLKVYEESSEGDDRNDVSVKKVMAESRIRVEFDPARTTTNDGILVDGRGSVILKTCVNNGLMNELSTTTSSDYALLSIMYRVKDVNPSSVTTSMVPAVTSLRALVQEKECQTMDGEKKKEAISQTVDDTLHSPPTSSQQIQTDIPKKYAQSAQTVQPYPSSSNSSTPTSNSSSTTPPLSNEKRYHLEGKPFSSRSPSSTKSSTARSRRRQEKLITSKTADGNKIEKLDMDIEENAEIDEKVSTSIQIKDNLTMTTNDDIHKDTSSKSSPSPQNILNRQQAVATVDSGMAFSRRPNENEPLAKRNLLPDQSNMVSSPPKASNLADEASNSEIQPTKTLTDDQMELVLSLLQSRMRTYQDQLVDDILLNTNKATGDDSRIRKTISPSPGGVCNHPQAQQTQLKKIPSRILRGTTNKNKRVLPRNTAAALKLQGMASDSHQRLWPHSPEFVRYLSTTTTEQPDPFSFNIFSRLWAVNLNRSSLFRFAFNPSLLQQQQSNQATQNLNRQPHKQFRGIRSSSKGLKKDAATTYDENFDYLRSHKDQFVQAPEPLRSDQICSETQTPPLDFVHQCNNSKNISVGGLVGHRDPTSSFYATDASGKFTRRRSSIFLNNTSHHVVVDATNPSHSTDFENKDRVQVESATDVTTKPTTLKSGIDAAIVKKQSDAELKFEQDYLTATKEENEILNTSILIPINEAQDARKRRHSTALHSVSPPVRPTSSSLRRQQSADPQHSGSSTTLSHNHQIQQGSSSQRTLTPSAVSHIHRSIKPKEISFDEYSEEIFEPPLPTRPSTAAGSTKSKQKKEKMINLGGPQMTPLLSSKDRQSSSDSAKTISSASIVKIESSRREKAQSGVHSSQETEDVDTDLSIDVDDDKQDRRQHSTSSAASVSSLSTASNSPSLSTASSTTTSTTSKSKSTVRRRQRPSATSPSTNKDKSSSKSHQQRNETQRSQMSRPAQSPQNESPEPPSRSSNRGLSPVSKYLAQIEEEKEHDGLEGVGLNGGEGVGRVGRIGSIHTDSVSSYAPSTTQNLSPPI